MIFAANSLPPTTDKSDGFFRRCIVIPFNAVFRETDKNYDENKLDKLITDDAKSYLFKVALELELSPSELILLIFFMNQEEPVLNIKVIKVFIVSVPYPLP